MLDELYIQAGTILENGHVAAYLPDELLPAREYWLVYRYDRQGVPATEIISSLADDIERVTAAARRRNIKFAGVQLDIDSPTAALAQYATFLRGMREQLPDGMQLSITALLDWFRNGTSVAGVVAQTDEFVPQFYDIGERDRQRPAVAMKIDAARWGPVFQRFRKRFRVGVSTFGRSRTVRGQPGAGAVMLYRDLQPIDVAAQPGFEMRTERNSAGEVILRYRAARQVDIKYTRFEPGDEIQFILPGQETVRAAVESARQMRAAGAIFFRWPAPGEVLVMQPEEAMAAAGGGAYEGHDLVDTIDGACAAVSCVDVYFESARPFSPKPLRYRIRASADLEYFLPEENLPVRMTGPAELELTLPAYCARGRMYLGRAVSPNPVRFAVEERP